MGVPGYYLSFFKHFATLAKPLNKVAAKEEEFCMENVTRRRLCDPTNNAG